MGAHFLNGFAGTELDIDVEQIIPHQDYNKPLRYSNDIALLILAKPANLNRGVGLACLPDISLALNDNKTCWITGWGTLALHGNQPNQLQEASLPIVAGQRCQSRYPNKIDTDSMLCAGSGQGGVDTCQGDSGGPLVCEHNGKWFLEGVTSWGYGCALRNHYGVYAKVRKFVSWIKESCKNASTSLGK